MRNIVNVLKPQKTWKKIDNDNVMNIWVCKTDGCKAKGKEVRVFPSFHDRHVVLTCDCGVDLSFSHTEIAVME